MIATNALAKKISVVLLFPIGLTLNLKAQQNAHSLEVNFQRSIAAFTANQNPMQGNAVGGELIFHYNVNKHQNKWSTDLGIKSIDAIFNYKNMHNVTLKANPINGELGNSYGLLGGITLPIINLGTTSLDFAPAFGVIYAEESWFSNQNPVIGSNLNFAMRAGLKLNVPINARTEIGANLDVLHYSNGGTRVPNNGMNVVSAGLGVKRYFADQSTTVANDATANADQKKHSFDIGFGFGRRGAYHSKKGFYRSALYGGYNYSVKSYLALSAGVDAVYYHNMFDANRYHETYQSSATSLERWRVGTAVGPDLWLGNLAIMLKYGYYVYYDSLKPVSTYWTAGAKYKLNKSLALQSKIYIHQTEADFIGFGLMFTK